MATRKTPSKAPAMKPVEAAVAAGKETVEKAMKAGSDAAAQNYEQVLAMTQDQVEKASQAAFQGYDDLASMNKDAMDAVVASGNIMAKGYEAIGKEMMAFTQVSIEANVLVNSASVKGFTPVTVFGGGTVETVVGFAGEVEEVESVEIVDHDSPN